MNQSSDQSTKIIGFWRPTDPDGEFGQWWFSDMVLNEQIIQTLPESFKNLRLCKERADVLAMLSNNNFNTAEKFMMMAKAALFSDQGTFNKMVEVSNPKDMKALGRGVANFDEQTWTTYCLDIVKLGNYLKFTQNEKLKEKLRDTGNATLAEASPLDKIWGIGLRFDNPKIYDKTKWKGTNLLGQAIEFVRANI